MKREKMFVLIATAVKKLQREAGISEDAATILIIAGLRGFPDNLVMNMDLLPGILNGIITVNTEFKLN
jgi:hypothetical protein